MLRDGIATAWPSGIVAGRGYGAVDPTVLAHFKKDQMDTFNANGGSGADPSTELTCQLVSAALFSLRVTSAG